MTTCRITKDPISDKDYSKDWSSWLAGDTISTSQWEVFGPDSALVVGVDEKSSDNTTVWLSGGTEGITYRVKNTIVSAGGRTEVHTLWVEMTQN